MKQGLFFLTLAKLCFNTVKLARVPMLTIASQENLWASAPFDALVCVCPLFSNQETRPVSLNLLASHYN